MCCTICCSPQLCDASLAFILCLFLYDSFNPSHICSLYFFVSIQLLKLRCTQINLFFNGSASFVLRFFLYALNSQLNPEYSQSADTTGFSLPSPAVTSPPCFFFIGRRVQFNTMIYYRIFQIPLFVPNVPVGHGDVSIVLGIPGHRPEAKRGRQATHTPRTETVKPTRGMIWPAVYCSSCIPASPT